MKGHRSHSFSSLLLWLGFSSCGLVFALGRPDWAEPHLSMPTPTGTYIAKNDNWAVVYGEVEFDLSQDGKMEKRCRYILENMQGKESSFFASISFDHAQYQLAEYSLHVHRKVLWHQINMKREAFAASSTSGGMVVLSSAEDIPARHRVVWQYTLRDQIGFLPWWRVEIANGWPTAKQSLFLAPGAAERGLSLRLVSHAAGESPASIKPDGDRAWVVTSVPATSRIPSDLVHQPEEDFLYPYALATIGTSDQKAWDDLARKYWKAWAETAAKVDHEQVQALAARLSAKEESALSELARLSSFVQREVLYDDSNEKGIEGWVPLGAEETLRSKKADCKGKALLLHALLKAVGVESRPMLLRAPGRYFRWGDHPGTANFNHVILAVKPPAGVKELPSTQIEGPMRGWIISDPTVETARFGSPLPGYEGLPALVVGPEGGERVAIRSKEPAAESARVELAARLDTAGVLHCTIEAADNGGSPLMCSLARTFSTEEVREKLRDALADKLAQPRLDPPSLLRPTESEEDAVFLRFTCAQSKAVQELSASCLLSNPLAVAAMVAGIPNGYLPRPPILEDDKIELSPPWDRRLNAHGVETDVAVRFNLSISASFSFAPPPARVEKRPWLDFELRWDKNSDGSWKGELRMKSPRGEWPAAERKERLRLLDELYRSLYTPLILKRN